MADENRRGAARFEVVGVNGSTLSGESFMVRDLSSTGLCIETTARPRPGATFRGRIDTGGGSVELDTACSWAHLVGVERWFGGDPATVYRAGLRFRNGGLETSLLVSLLRGHALVVPPRPVHCILPLDSERLEGVSGPIPGEVRRLGVGGLSLVLPLTPPLPSPLDLVILLDGRDCRCRGQVIQQRESRILGGTRSTELLLALPEVDGETIGHIQPYVDAVLEQTLGPGTERDTRRAGLGGRGGALSLLA